MPDVAVVCGTYNRLPLLKKALASFRRACGGLTYVLIVVDGGSTDGSREWLLEQPDVQGIFQELPLTGAVAAFNLGFDHAVDTEAPFVAVLNDDDEVTTGGAIRAAVEMMRANDTIGAVAFETDLRGQWDFECVHGKPYANKGVFRREAGMAAARASGDPEGRCWWSRDHHTYASDTELGCWIWRLGWTIVPGVGLRVHDNAAGASDTLRDENIKTYGKSGSVAKYHARWDDYRRMNYDHTDAVRFGGRIRVGHNAASTAAAQTVAAIRAMIDPQAEPGKIREMVGLLEEAVSLKNKIEGQT